MASYGGVDLDMRGAAVFELTSQSDDEEFVYALPDGSQAVIPASSRYILVRSCAGEDMDEVHENAREAANRAIDIYFGQGGRPLVLAHNDSTYMVSWVSSAGHKLRIVGRNQLTTRFRAKGVVRDANGQLVEPPTMPPTAWHEALRYYRVSEASTDLYDSFRNLYLAIESLLSHVVPTITKPNAKPEGDSVWLKRALRYVGQVIDLTSYSPVSPKAPHNAIHQDLYANLRTAIFHAKTGRATWTPQAWSSRSTIVAARLRYARMFRALAAEYLDIKYPTGGLAKAFWEGVWATQLADHEVFVSNDPTQIEDEPKGEYQLAPAGGGFLKLPTVAADDMAADWCRGVKGVEVASTVHHGLGEVRRFGTLQHGEVAMVDSLHAPLIVDGVDELQVVLLVEGRTYGQPRQDFDS
jgi:hypothetical protein